MKKQLYSLGALLCALFITVFAQAQTFTYTINAGNVTTPLSKITGVLTPIAPGTGVINAGDNVAMPWVTPAGAQNAGYLFTISGIPAGATNFTWSTKGDLTQPAGISSTATTSSATIKHNNTIVRSSSTTDLGQSKGRIYFSYTIPGSPCGSFIYSFDVFKQFAGTNVDGTASSPDMPKIVGPGCILPNTQYTYSIDPIMSDNLSAQIGMDRYFWDISQVGAVTSYQSTDSSSITFITGATVPTTCTIKCGLGMSNYNPLQTTAALQAVASKTILASAGTPTVTLSGAATGAIVSGTPRCVNTNGSVVTPLTFSVTPQPGAIYTWTFGTVGANGTGSVNGWNNGSAGTAPFTSTGTSLTIANIFNQPGTVTLKVMDACGIATYYYYEVKRTLTAADANLVSLSANCLTPGSSAAVTLASSASLNSLVWTANPLFSLSATTAGPLGTTAPGSYTLNAGFLGCASSVPYTMNVKPATVTITTPSPLCFPRNTAGTNNVTATPTAASGYTWTTSAGTITGSSNVASLTTVNTSPFTLSAVYTVVPGCATSSAATPAYLQPVTPTVTLPTCISSSPFAITVTNYPGYGSYTLTYVSGTNFLGSYTVSGGTINVIPNGLSGSGVYTVSHTSGSCTAAGTNVTITTSTAPFTVSAVNLGGYVLLAANPNSNNYAWYNCTSNGFITNTTAPNASIQLNTPSTGATNYYGAQATIGGCTYRVCVQVVNWLPRPAGDGGIKETPGLPVEIGRVYPNPNNGTFTIDLKSTAESAFAVVYDMKGEIVYKTSLSQGINKVNDMAVATGLYTVVMLVDGKYYREKIAVTR
ncbi:T9SS type A sorting domain-containing protein [Chitinophagaceae bacterium MMS25-I14]